MYRYLFSLLVLAALLAGACGGDKGADIPQEVELSVADFTATIPNGSPTGFVIGEIQATSNSAVSFSFELISESVPGAFSVGSSNGRIIVNDPALINHEQNPIISATVEVTQGEEVSAAAISINIDELNVDQLEILDYFKEIALGFEFGTASQITRKWREPLQVFISGSPSTELRSELTEIIDEIRELITDDFIIELVDNQEEANYNMFFGSAAEYSSRFGVSESTTGANWGYFFVDWDSDEYLNVGHMYVDIFRANEVEQRHLLREEFTQSLGLARDSERYPNSIFQGVWTHTTEYTDLDRELIRILYHPEMTSDLNSITVDPVIRDILTSN